MFHFSPWMPAIGTVRQAARAAAKPVGGLLLLTHMFHPYFSMPSGTGRFWRGHSHSRMRVKVNGSSEKSPEASCSANTHTHNIPACVLLLENLCLNLQSTNRLVKRRQIWSKVKLTALCRSEQQAADVQPALPRLQEHTWLCTPWAEITLLALRWINAMLQGTGATSWETHRSAICWQKGDTFLPLTSTKEARGAAGGASMRTAVQGDRAPQQLLSSWCMGIGSLPAAQPLLRTGEEGAARGLDTHLTPLQANAELFLL